ncbi:MAG TPA: hypothetical protein VIL32_13190 [Steroidobacteraceae bacterium]
MSDPILAAIIAASATIIHALLQLKAALAREAAARAATMGGVSNSRKKSRSPTYLLGILVAASGVGGFALAHWLSQDEREAQRAHELELQEKIAQVSRTAAQLESTLENARTEMEQGIMRRIGAEGAIVTAVVPPCKAPPLAGSVEVPRDVPAAIDVSTCTEADASPVMLCVNVPANAIISNVAVYARTPDSTVPWAASLVTAGEDIDRARFGATPVETQDDNGKQVCQSFVNWATDRSRIARMVVRYTF